MSVGVSLSIEKTTAGQSNYCLLVTRAGRTNIFPLPNDNVEFGYAPHAQNGLILHDDELEDLHGDILYDETQDEDLDVDELNNMQEDTDKRTSQKIPATFLLKSRAKNIKLNGMDLPPRDAVKIQLYIDDVIAVGTKYVLKVAHYQPAPDKMKNRQADSDSVASSTNNHHESPFALAKIPPHLSRKSRRLMQYMPEIYHPEEPNDTEHFLTNFLGLFESVYFPMTWTVENFDLCLHPISAPPAMLPWLARWYGFPFWEETLPVEVQRNILCQAARINRSIGTVSGLQYLLEIYLGLTQKTVTHCVKIDDLSTKDNHFRVVLVKKLNTGDTETAKVDNTEAAKVEAQMKELEPKIKQLIDWFKPAHTTCELVFEEHPDFKEHNET